jgi:hypothetical protein
MQPPPSGRFHARFDIHPWKLQLNGIPSAVIPKFALREQMERRLIFISLPWLLLLLVVVVDIFI